nr:U3 small nucleolar ribonucleoprotein [Cryptomonas sp.]
MKNSKVNIGKNKNFDYIFGIISPGVLRDEFGLISSSKIILTSSVNFLHRTIINIKDDVFLNGCFRTTDHKILAVSCRSKKIDLFDLHKGNLIKTLKGHTSPVHAISFSDNGLNLISGGDDGFLKIWDIAVQSCVSFVKLNKVFIRSVSYLPKNNQIYACSSYDGFIRINDIRSNDTPIVKFNHGCPVEKFRFTPDGKNIISIGGNTLKLWDLTQRKLIMSLKEEKPLINIDTSSNNMILYSSLNYDIKSFDLKTCSTRSLLFFKKNVVSFGVLLNGIAISFSDGTISFKKNVKIKFEIKNRNENDEKRKKKIPNSNIFFIPKKNVPKNSYKKHQAQNCFKKKKIKLFKDSKTFSSFDYSLRTFSLNRILDSFFEVKKRSVILSYLHEIIVSENFDVKLDNQVEMKFFSLINIILENMRLLYIPRFFWILLKFYETISPVVDFSKSYLQVLKYFRIINNLLRKSFDSYTLKYVTETINFCE